MYKKKLNHYKALLAGVLAATMSFNFIAFAEEEILLDDSDAFVSIDDKYLNIRSEAETSSSVVGVIEDNGYVEIVEEEAEDWYKIKSGEVEGYVSAEYILTGNEAQEKKREAVTRIAEVTTDVLNVRTDGDKESAVIKKAHEGEKLTVAQNLGEWVKVKLEDGSYGYVANEYVSLREEYTTATNLGESIVEFASQFIGNPYVWGGTSLTSGADCSGFVMSVFAQFGYGLPRTTYTQVGCGREVSVADLQPGDLVFYYPGVEHVAIYAGNGTVVHAANSRVGITKTDLYWNGAPVACRRIIG